ncbi:MAG TPA: alpha/beta fold hydrolase [Pseudoneobacillus sp.]|nr:alpha/beta fold hydrolase [Pseudoneobacillus sp.]
MKKWGQIDSGSGQTSRMTIWKKNKATLWYYPTAMKKYRTPLFLIYSLINQPYILDLGPGISMINAFTDEGYDVYLFDFGIPGYEDKDITLDNYILDYIQNGVKRALRHSNAADISIIGYCLGGTLATIYTAVAKEPIKNLILFAPPIDFSHITFFNNWHKALQKEKIDLNEIIDLYGIIPANVMEAGLRLLTSPISFSPYLSLLDRADDKKYVDKWQRFNNWAKNHVPFVGATLKSLLNDLLKDNKLIQNKLFIRNNRVELSNIKANLLVISTDGDQIVPEELIKPIMPKVSSQDKTYKRVKGGHVTLAIKGYLPDFLAEWLKTHS